MLCRAFAGFALLLAAVQPVAAAELVVGGAFGMTGAVVERDRPDGVSFGFTPRGGGGEKLRFDLSAAPAEPAAQPRAVVGGGRQDFILGGALVWNDWRFGSSVIRLDTDGFESELLGAGVGYGNVTARLALGELPAQKGEGRSAMLLSTDLAAWSWLTVEGDLALTGADDGHAERAALGRLGLRLNF